MSRYVDRLAAPTRKRDMKVVLVSCGRNGTMGLHTALQILGFKPYHMVDVFTNGERDIRLMTEAVRAAHLGEGGRFGRADFDTWLLGEGGEYDCTTDIAMYLADDLVAAYPEAKFILTLREPAAWMRSVNRTMVPFQRVQRRFPFSLLKYFDGYLWYLFAMQRTFEDVLFRGEGHGADGEALAYYRDHNKRMQELAPADKLLVVSLEDGLGWEQICPFLGVDTPDAPYPRMNNPAQFQDGARMVVRQGTIRASLRLLATIVPAVGIAAWYGLKYHER